MAQSGQIDFQQELKRAHLRRIKSNQQVEQTKYGASRQTTATVAQTDHEPHHPYKKSKKKRSNDIQAPTVNFNNQGFVQSIHGPFTLAQGNTYHSQHHHHHKKKKKRLILTKRPTTRLKELLYHCMPDELEGVKWTVLVAIFIKFPDFDICRLFVALSEPKTNEMSSKTRPQCDAIVAEVTKFMNKSQCLGKKAHEFVDNLQALLCQKKHVQSLRLQCKEIDDALLLANCDDLETNNDEMKVKELENSQSDTGSDTFNFISKDVRNWRDRDVMFCATIYQLEIRADIFKMEFMKLLHSGKKKEEIFYEFGVSEQENSTRVWEFVCALYTRFGSV
eukprot:256846_1